MKRSLMILTPLFVFALAAGVLAQRSVGFDDNRKATMDVDFSGEVDLNWVYHDRTIRELNGGGSAATLAAFTIGGSAVPGAVGGAEAGGMWVADPVAATTTTVGGAASTEAAAFFYGRVTLRAVSHLADNVHGVIEVSTIDHEGGGISSFGNGLTGFPSFVDLRQAYVDMMQVWDPRISFRLGLQDVVMNLRNPSRSGAFFCDLTESESAWHGVQAPAPVTFYDRMEPIGARFRYEDIHDSNVDFKVWIIPSVQNGFGGAISTLDSLEQLYMANVDWYVPGLSEPEGESKIQVSLAYMNGGNQGNEIWGLAGGATALGTAGAGGHQMGVFDFGLGFDVVGIGDPGVELYTEWHYQAGTAGKDGTGLATSATLHHAAWAINTGFRYDALQTQGQPWFELNYTRRSGDKSMTDGTNRNYLSYENIDDFAIVEGNEIGLDVDTGYSAYKLKGGLKFSSAHGSDNIALDLKAGAFNFASKQPLAILGTEPRSRDLGWEIDAKVTYWYNDQLSFSTLLAFLTSADALKNFTAQRDTGLWMLNLGMNFKF